MRIGFCSDHSDKNLAIARGEGFDSIELFIKGSSLEGSDGEVDALLKGIKDKCDRYGVAIWAVHLTGVNHLHPDADKRAQTNDWCEKMISKLHLLGAKVFSTNTWGDPDKTVEENIPIYKKVFSRYAKVANDSGVKIAMENCPHGVPPQAHNICYSPRTCELLFDAVPDEAIGLEYDPSHHIWQGIDTMKYLRVFSGRIHSVHAKDTEIDYEVLGKTGYYEGRWWRYRIPGWGEVDWRQFFTILHDIGYNGDIIIEHEDPVFAGERFQEGLRLGLRFLKQFIP